MYGLPKSVSILMYAHFSKPEIQVPAQNIAEQRLTKYPRAHERTLKHAEAAPAMDRVQNRRGPLDQREARQHQELRPLAAPKPAARAVKQRVFTSRNELKAVQREAAMAVNQRRDKHAAYHAKMDLIEACELAAAWDQDVEMTDEQMSTLQAAREKVMQELQGWAAHAERLADLELSSRVARMAEYSRQAVRLAVVNYRGDAEIMKQARQILATLHDVEQTQKVTVEFATLKSKITQAETALDALSAQLDLNDLKLLELDRPLDDNK